MPVSFGLRDEGNERINSILKKLMSLVLIPEHWDEVEFSKELKRLSFTTDDLMKISNDEMIAYLARYNFNFENIEAFADLLVQLSAKPDLELLRNKALALYIYVQEKSNAFSFGINNKINALRKS